MPITFPTNPSSGQTYTVGDKTFTYNGKGWTTSASPTPATSGTDTGTVKRLQYGLNILLGR